MPSTGLVVSCLQQMMVTRQKWSSYELMNDIDSSIRNKQATIFSEKKWSRTVIKSITFIILTLLNITLKSLGHQSFFNMAFAWQLWQNLLALLQFQEKLAEYSWVLASLQLIYLVLTLIADTRLPAPCGSCHITVKIAAVAARHQVFYIIRYHLNQHTYTVSDTNCTDIQITQIHRL